MKSKEFVITPKHLITGLLAFIAIAVLGFAVIPQAVAAVTAPQPAEVAAREGAQAFLSTDVEVGQAAWETSVCKVSSQASCEVLKKSLSPMLWPSVESKQMRRSCRAVAAKLTQDVPAGEAAPRTQLWQVTLECSDQASGEATNGDIQVVVSEQPDGWKFERALFNQESQDEK